MALKVSRFRDVTKHLLGKLTKGLLIPPASLCCATSKAQQVCSLIGTTPGVIKMPKGAVFIRVKESDRQEEETFLSYAPTNLANSLRNLTDRKKKHSFLMHLQILLIL